MRVHPHEHMSVGIYPSVAWPGGASCSAGTAVSRPLHAAPVLHQPWSWLWRPNPMWSNCPIGRSADVTPTRAASAHSITRDLVARFACSSGGCLCTHGHALEFFFGISCIDMCIGCIGMCIYMSIYYLRPKTHVPGAPQIPNLSKNQQNDVESFF